MTFKSAYVRLTAFYVLIMLLISLTFSMIVYRLSSDELSQGLGRQSRFIRNLPLDDFLTMRLGEIENNRATQLAESTHHLQLTLLYFNLLILIIASGASYYFAKRTLRPIEDMMEVERRFTADASHELKTPLTAMHTEIEVALRDQKMQLPEAKVLLKSNLEEINKLETLSQALLTLAKYDFNGAQHFVHVDLAEGITAAFQKVELLAQQKSISFANRLESLQVKGDPVSLQQLFVILLDNTIKYSHPSTEVSILMRKVGKEAEIRVVDHGIGIKASDIPFIFDRFFRADHSRAKVQATGYGLGLAIAKQIVALHHGTIAVTSTLGKGSQFTVRLPLV